jgi:hypothetical protein
MLIEGYRWILGNAILFLHRYRMFTDLSIGLTDALPPLGQIPLFDPSGFYLLQVTINLSEGSPDLVSRGLTELEAVQSQLDGIVRLNVPDKMALDTRAR